MATDPEEAGATGAELTLQPGPVVRVPAKLEADHGGVLAIIPRDIDEAQRYASGLIKANIVPDSFRVDGKKDNPVNAPLVLMGVLKSMELGLPPQTGIGTLLPINGRFTVWGDGAVALIQRQRVIQKQEAVTIGTPFSADVPLGEWPDDHGWSVSYWRVGQDEPYVGTFTVRDAKRANLWMNSYKKPWIMFPDRMLFNRARAFALRDGFADCLMGLGIAEEVRDMQPDERDGGTAASSRLAALSDEPETKQLDAPAPEKADPPADLLDQNF